MIIKNWKSLQGTKRWKITTRKELEDLSTKLSVSKPTPRKYAKSATNISSADMDKFVKEKILKKRPLAKKQLTLLFTYLWKKGMDLFKTRINEDIRNG